MPLRHLREILVGEGLLKIATGPLLGEITAHIGGDTRYGTSIQVYIEGNSVGILKSSWSAFMGSDGPGGSVHDESLWERGLPLDGRIVVRAIQDIWKKDLILSRYGKFKDFSWQHPYDRYAKGFRGLTVENAQKVLDGQIMTEDVWKAKVLKPAIQDIPSIKPLPFSKSMTPAQFKDMLAGQGIVIQLKRDFTGSFWEMVNGRLNKALLKMLEQSADSQRGSEFSFPGGLVVQFGKHPYTGKFILKVR